ncbi:type IX secretion system plug protein [Flavobacterium sp. WC2509]|uniref:type IX secretion system plug protein n=1 Tax=Flavobacterium sp. WC2509 TaxID=3461406 RepID=UPI00404497E4
MKTAFVVLLSFFYLTTNAQVQTEIAPPYNIKTASFIQNSQNVVPIFKLGESFDFQFDDLFGNEADYYYEITHCDYNWAPTDIPKSEYLSGFDGQKIQEYVNSFNTLQVFSHYKLSIPNNYTKLLLSGNYVLTILNSDKEVVLKRYFVLYENSVSVAVKIRRPRTVKNIYSKHNLNFEINTDDFLLQNPTQNLKVVLLQNANFNTAIKNIVPQYNLGNVFIYKYDQETQFWAGNEFLNFDSKDIKNANNYVSYVNSDNGIYNTHLFTNNAKTSFPYSNYSDVNGNFTERKIDGENYKIESDYSWVYFTLSSPLTNPNSSVYIVGMFNNYSMTPEFKMDFNTKNGLYEKAILIKQGFTNYQYVTVNNKGIIDQENAVDGNFYQTENDYTVLVYYKGSVDRYVRVVGKGAANSLNITN